MGTVLVAEDDRVVVDRQQPHDAPTSQGAPDHHFAIEDLLTFRAGARHERDSPVVGTKKGG